MSMKMSPLTVPLQMGRTFDLIISTFAHNAVK